MMNDSFRLFLAFLYPILAAAHIRVLLRGPEVGQLFLARLNLAVVGAIGVGLAVLCAFDGKPVLTGLYASGVAMVAWWFWNNRPNKRKHIDKVLGKIKNLGHRLTVVPA